MIHLSQRLDGKRIWKDSGFFRASKKTDDKGSGHSDQAVLQLSPSRAEIIWFRGGSQVIAVLVVVAIWFFRIAPEEKSPATLMVKPATAILDAGIGHTMDVGELSGRLGFNVEVPHLEPLGAQFASMGQSEFGGQDAAVMQYQYGQSIVLLYSFNDRSRLFSDMKQIDPGENPLYLTSDGAVSVVAWQDRSSVFHALAAKSTEEDIIALARLILTYI